MEEAHPATLRLDEAVTSYEFIDGFVTRHPEQHFLDFVLDGQSLRDLADGGQDLVTPLWRAWPATAVAESVDALLGARSSGQGAQRVELLVCSICGDTDCGAVTARLTMTPTVVVWSEFLWVGPTSDVSPVVGLPTSVEFERHQYEATFAGALDRVASLAYDELAHRGRRFLWPWQWGWRDPKS